jgi:hypothetical protein
MRIIKLSAAVFSISLFLIGCNTDQQQQTAITETYPNDAVVAEEIPIDDYWAKDNFDLQRVGNLLERSDDPREFEAYLNDDDGLNNLDLNGDGYADYISVQEFEDRDSNSRGLSLFSRFGPDLIQEIAQIFFYRDEPRYPGSRVLLYGNDQLYGDNYYYETNWLDRPIGLASYLFSDRDSYYRSPYYYDNYPSGYTVYEVVETPYYRTRIEQLYPEPVFVFTQAPPTYFERIKIKSPNNDRHLGQIYARLVKPTKDQAEFLKNTPRRKLIAKRDGDNKPGRVDPPRSDRGEERGNPARDERGAERGNPDKPDAGNPNRGGGNPNKPDAGNPNRGGGNPNKPDAGNPNRGGGNPNKPDAGNPNKGGNPNKPAAGNPNKGGGQGKGKKP